VNLCLSDSTDIFLSHTDPEMHSFTQRFAYKWDLALSWWILVLKRKVISVTRYKACRTAGKVYGTRKVIAISL